MLEYLKRLWERVFAERKTSASLPEMFARFHDLLDDHQQVMEIIADMGEKVGGDYVFDRKYLTDSTRKLHDTVLRVLNDLNFIASDRYLNLYNAFDRIFLAIDAELTGRLPVSRSPWVLSLEEISPDAPELSGGKAGAQAQIMSQLKLPVPPGFVVTTSGFFAFLEGNDLRDRIHEWIEEWMSGRETLTNVSARIRYSVLACVVPRDLAKEIKGNAAALGGPLVLRSSAYGEDGESSFAGLHESMINIAPEDILSAYKRVVASLYAPAALEYRRRTGMVGEEPAMAVLCQRMIDSMASGVIHSVAMEADRRDCLTVFAAPGLGRTVVDGSGEVDRFLVERTAPHRIRVSMIAHKTRRIRPVSGGGEETAPVKAEQMDAPAISEDTVAKLASWALTLEGFFKRPQEIEWAIDGEGRCWILQSRRLAMADGTDLDPEHLSERQSEYPVLIENRGEVVHGGVGAGPVFNVRAGTDMSSFPDRGVLVTRHTAPWLAEVVPKASAIIAERGSAAGHLATIAREFRVPTLVSVEGAVEILEDGMEVTLDAHARTVYRGIVKELIDYELLKATVFEDAPEFRLLRRMLRRIAPLRLVDPDSPDFTPENCTTVHDILRYVHEKAVEELARLPFQGKPLNGQGIWTLRSSVPLGLRILDLGGGVDPGVEGNKIVPDQIRSKPLRAVWEGISAPGVWTTDPVPVDFSGFMSSLSKNWDSGTGGAAADGLNLAVVDEDYMNLHLRLGYHFNMIDTRMGEQGNRNYIYFRFVGGVTGLTRRSRRVQLLGEILSKLNFKVDIKGDLIVARVRHMPEEETGNLLNLVGRLIGFTRQLDVRLKNEEDVPRFVSSFFEQYLPSPGSTGHTGG